MTQTRAQALGIAATNPGLNIRQPEPFDDLRQKKADAVVQADVGKIDQTEKRNPWIG